MATLTLYEARTSSPWSELVNLCPTDPRLVQYFNRTVRRLMPKGKWVGTYQRYQICTSSACITWPRQIETIEAFWICQTPGTIRNEWFESLPNGPGLLDSSSSVGSQLIDRGRGFRLFKDVTTASKIRLYPSYASDVGKTVLLQGRDENGSWIRTNGGDNNGELLTLASPFVETTNKFFPPGPIGVQKQTTKGPVRAYAVDATTGALTPIAYWEPDETLPDYRRSLIPYLQNHGSCGNSCGDDERPQVTVLAKLKFIPVVNDTDYLLIGNQGALEEGVKALWHSDRGNTAEAQYHEAEAIRLLEEELMTYQGHGVVQPFRVDKSDCFGAGSIENVVNAYDLPLTR